VVGMPGCLPAVHRQSVSTIGCPPTPVRRPGPGVQPSGVQPVQCPVIWLPRPDVAVRPAGVQPVRRPAVWCPAVWCLSVRPVAAVSSRVRRVVAMGSISVQRAAVTTGSSRVPCGPAPVPGGSVDGPRSMDAGTAAESCAGRRGASVADWAGVCSGGRLRPTDRAGQTAARGACRWRLRSSRGVAGARLPHGIARGGHLGLELRLLCVVIAEADVRVDGPGGPNEFGGEDGARPQRGPAR
jgi:hypothetical protein